MALDLYNLDEDVIRFMTERHLASLTLLRPDGSPHVTPVGFTWDNEAKLVRVITWNGSKKARLLDSSGGGQAAVCQVDGGRWLTLEGRAVVSGEPDRALAGVERYAERYRQPKDRGPDRRVIEISVERIMGRV